MRGLRVLELYSGIGGMHFALKESKLDGEVVAAVDINTVANEAYRFNFPDTTLLNRNVESITPELMSALNPNVLLMSPPCQPFTRNGLQNDSEDRRSDSLHRLIDALKRVDSIEYVLLENVKGFDTSNMRQLFIDHLATCGLFYEELIVSPHQFGVPNSRLRYYCLARRKRFPSTESLLQKYEAQDCHLLRDIIETEVDESYFLPAKFYKRIRVLDICYENSRRSCCFTKAYTHFLEGTGSVFTHNSPEVVDNIFENLDKTNDKQQYDALCQNLRLRFFTPKEVSRLMAFPETFSFPSSISKKQCYRLLGNSINVKVVSELLYFLINS